MMSRRRLLVTTAAGILAAPLAADAQAVAKTPVIGVLWSTGAPSPFAEAFETGLRELGWVNGQNVTIEYRYAEGKAERFPDLANELVRLRVDVIVAPPAPATLATKAATTMIPIVFTLGANPTAFGVLTNRQPGGAISPE